MTTEAFFTIIFDIIVYLLREASNIFMFKKCPKVEEEYLLVLKNYRLYIYGKK